MSRSIWQDILSNGISKIPAPLPKAVWHRLYLDFDAFSNSVSELPEVRKAYNDEAKAWQKESGLGNSYGGYFSPYFRDTSKQEGKDKKRIIQVCEPYYRYLNEQHQAGLRKLSSFRPFPKNAGESHSFMGAAPREGGFTKLLPLPHAVRPFDGSIRHSAVFFWHLPNVEMQDFDTKVEVEDDLGLSRKTIPKKPAAQSTNLSSSASTDAASFLNRQATAYDNLLSVYEARHEVCHDIRRTVLTRVLDGLGPNLSALDVGCGAGAYLSLMAERGLDAEGIDLSSSMVSAAQARSGRPVRCADFQSESFDRQFDLVFAQAFVHLFPKAEGLQVINKLKSLARKRVYFSTSIALQPSEGLEEKDGAVRFRSRYTASEFASLITQCSADGLWRARSFELVDPDNKHWVQVSLDRD